MRITDIVRNSVVRSIVLPLETRQMRENVPPVRDLDTSLRLQALAWLFHLEVLL